MSLQDYQESVWAFQRLRAMPMPVLEPPVSRSWWAWVRAWISGKG